MGFFDTILPSRGETEIEAKASGRLLKQSQIKRYREEYEKQHPPGEHRGHSWIWTIADGVWYCRSCGEWYRTWEETPYEDE